MQETPDTSEALACVPTLQLEDIPKQAFSIPTAVSEQQNVTMLQHELFTNDVLYMETALDMRTLPPNLLPLIPLFCRHASTMAITSFASCLIGSCAPLLWNEQDLLPDSLLSAACMRCAACFQ